MKVAITIYTFSKNFCVHDCVKLICVRYCLPTNETSPLIADLQ